MIVRAFKIDNRRIRPCSSLSFNDSVHEFLETVKYPFKFFNILSRSDEFYI